MGLAIQKRLMKRTALIIISLLASTTYRTAASPTITPPAQAVATGFHQLSFDEEFKGPLDIGYGTAGHKWNANMWWEPVAPADAFLVKDGVLTITATPSEKAELCTQYHDAAGGRYFQGGYFEARMRCTDWSAFWLFCANRPHVSGNRVLPSNPLTWTNEIDVIETDPGLPNTAFCTLHQNTSGDGGVPDVMNHPKEFWLPSPVVGVWHTYGVLWTQGEITWYVDNVKVASARPFPSTWQPAQLILSASPGGVNGSRSSVLPPVTEVQWVRVWEK